MEQSCVNPAEVSLSFIFHDDVPRGTLSREQTAGMKKRSAKNTFTDRFLKDGAS